MPPSFKSRKSTGSIKNRPGFTHRPRNSAFNWYPSMLFLQRAGGLPWLARFQNTIWQTEQPPNEIPSKANARHCRLRSYPRTALVGAMSLRLLARGFFIWTR